MQPRNWLRCKFPVGQCAYTKLYIFFIVMAIFEGDGVVIPPFVLPIRLSSLL